MIQKSGRFSKVIGVAPLLLLACAEKPPQNLPAGNRAIISGDISAQKGQASASGLASPLGSISQEALTQAMTDRLDALAGVFPLEIAKGTAATPQLKGDDIELQFDSAAMFEIASAQLKPQSLLMISRLAKWQRADGRVVLHVEGREALQTVDDLAARRAASVADFLLAEGAPSGRVRAQSQPFSLVATSGTPSSVIAIIVVPVVKGREAQAWMPPVLAFAR